MYDVRRLRSLCAIADAGSLTGAAAALDFTQPAISQHLAALEAEVGAPLVNRSRGGAELTAAGALLVEHARAALDRLALAELQVGELLAGEQRRVRIAAPSSSLARLVPLAVAELHRGMPDAEVTVSECGPPKALAKLGRGDIDVAVTFRRVGGAAPEGVEERTLLEASMYGGVPRRHLRAARGRRGAHVALGVDVRGRAAPAPARQRRRGRAGPVPRRRLDPGPGRDLARPDPRAVPRGRLRAADRVRERRPARDARDGRRRPGGHARPWPHQARHRA